MGKAAAHPRSGRDPAPTSRDAHSSDGLLGGFPRAQFAVIDVLRRAQGDLMGARGLGPSELPYREIASAPQWRLRDYGGRAASHPLLIVAAPIKRPYIWDLAPAVSAVRRCRREGLHVYLLEWRPASRRLGSRGLDDCVAAIGACVEKVSRRSSAPRPFLMGHSLGGTLATIYGASHPQTIGALVLLSAPLCFRPRESRFRDALVSLVPPDLSEVEPVPGSLLSYMSFLASPRTFVWSRLIDGITSVADRAARDIQARVERWALDEVALSGKLVRQIVDWLYRENRLCRGTLTVGGTALGPSKLKTPVLAVVNAEDELTPLASIRAFTDAMPGRDAKIISYPGESGVCLQHLGILIGRAAHARVWPRITAWLKAHRGRPPGRRFGRDRTRPSPAPSP